MGANEDNDGEYTPNTADMRRWHTYRVTDGEQGKKEFDRWIENVRAEAKAEALNEAADQTPVSWDFPPYASALEIRPWLRDRAEKKFR